MFTIAAPIDKSREVNTRDEASEKDLREGDVASDVMTEHTEPHGTRWGDRVVPNKLKDVVE